MIPLSFLGFAHFKYFVTVSSSIFIPPMRRRKSWLNQHSESIVILHESHLIWDKYNVYQLEWLCSLYEGGSHAAVKQSCDLIDESSISFSFVYDNRLKISWTNELLWNAMETLYNTLLNIIKSKHLNTETWIDFVCA